MAAHTIKLGYKMHVKDDQNRTVVDFDPPYVPVLHVSIKANKDYENPSKNHCKSPQVLLELKNNPLGLLRKTIPALLAQPHAKNNSLLKNAPYIGLPRYLS